jgi:hypothetical protein
MYTSGEELLAVDLSAGKKKEKEISKEMLKISLVRRE